LVSSPLTGLSTPLPRVFIQQYGTMAFCTTIHFSHQNICNNNNDLKQFTYKDKNKNILQI
jgi:hypothetical protein